MSIGNLEAMLAKADRIDLAEGQIAYIRYHRLLRMLSAKYGFGIQNVAAAFCSLSPNSDYFGNLRSTVSVLQGLREGIEHERITVSTYNHCKTRAIAYVLGERDFLTETKGPKITNFYRNIVDPNDVRWVTIDGHMSAIWQGRDLTMREALVTKLEYHEIASATKTLAFKHFMIPNQMQAILWFTRKRVARVRFDPQGGLFDFANNDVWRTLVDIDIIKPYSLKERV